MNCGVHSRTLIPRLLYSPDIWAAIISIGY
jgi:hypothetical protein